MCKKQCINTLDFLTKVVELIFKLNEHCHTKSVFKQLIKFSLVEKNKLV